MVTSGGYQKKNALTIADSIENLDRKFGILSRGNQSALSSNREGAQKQIGSSEKYRELI